MAKRATESGKTTGGDAPLRAVEDETDEAPQRLRDNPVLRALYAPWLYLGVWPGFVVSTTVFGSFALAMGYLRQDRAGSWFGRPWSWSMGLLTPMRVHVRGRENIDPDQSYVIVANHQSQYDIFVLYGWLGIDFRWVMKAELKKVPFIGTSMYKLGHVFIDRKNREKAWESIRAAKDKLVGGTSICFFPEGTRSNDGNLLPFKKGAFRLAAELGLPVLPVTVSGTHDILPNRTMAVFPGRAELIIHAAIQPPESADAEAVQRLSDQARAAIESGLSDA